MLPERSMENPAKSAVEKAEVFRSHDNSELLALAERCERATGPGRELDSIIHAALGGLLEITEHDNWIIASDGERSVTLGRIDPGKVQRNFSPMYHDTPSYTASLDAAMTLVPEGHSVSLETCVGGHAYASAWHDTPSYNGLPCEGRNPSLVLALCAAALRARGA